jgi:adenosylcobinamide-phosphate synthase
LVYGGVVADDPYVHPEGDRQPGPAAIRAAVALIWRAWGVLLALAALAALLRLVP